MLSEICESICVSHSLKVLSLANCGITDEEFRCLVAALALNDSLESVYLWGNYLTKDSAELILELLRAHNKTLTDIQIFNNAIEHYDYYLEVGF